MRIVTKIYLIAFFPVLSFSQNLSSNSDARQNLIKEFCVKVESYGKDTACGIILTIKDKHAYILTVFHAFGHEPRTGIKETKTCADSVVISFPLSNKKEFHAKLWIRNSTKDYIIYKSLNELESNYKGIENSYYRDLSDFSLSEIMLLGEPIGKDRLDIKFLKLLLPLQEGIINYKYSHGGSPKPGDSGGCLYTKDNIIIAIHQKKDSTFKDENLYSGLSIDYVIKNNPELNIYDIDWRPFTKEDSDVKPDLWVENDLPIELARQLLFNIRSSPCEKNIKSFYKLNRITISGTYKNKKSATYKGFVYVAVNDKIILSQKFKGEKADLTKKIIAKLCPKMGIHKRQKTIIAIGAGVIAGAALGALYLFYDSKRENERLYNKSVAPDIINKYVNETKKDGRSMTWAAVLGVSLTSGAYITYKKCRNYKNELMDE